MADDCNGWIRGDEIRRRWRGSELALAARRTSSARCWHKRLAILEDGSGQSLGSSALPDRGVRSYLEAFSRPAHVSCQWRR